MDRFWAKVERTDGCWLWTASTDKGGYGRFSDRTAKCGWRPAHRMAYELSVGPIPDGLDIDHLCHNADLTCAGGATCIHRRCVRPDHLEPADRATNLERGRHPAPANNLNREKTHCPRGHIYDEQNTYLSRKGSRECRTCSRASTTAWREQQPRRGPAPTEREVCPSGHPYDGENLVITKAGSRRCRTCARQHSQAYRRRRSGHTT